MIYPIDIRDFVNDLVILSPAYLILDLFFLKASDSHSPGYTYIDTYI